jgi:hypothetical protein
VKSSFAPFPEVSATLDIHRQPLVIKYNLARTKGQSPDTGNHQEAVAQSNLVQTRTLSSEDGNTHNTEDVDEGFSASRITNHRASLDSPLKYQHEEHFSHKMPQDCSAHFQPACVSAHSHFDSPSHKDTAMTENVTSSQQDWNNRLPSNGDSSMINLPASATHGDVHIYRGAEVTFPQGLAPLNQQQTNIPQKRSTKHPQTDPGSTNAKSTNWPSSAHSSRPQSRQISHSSVMARSLSLYNVQSRGTFFGGTQSHHLNRVTKVTTEVDNDLLMSKSYIDQLMVENSGQKKLLNSHTMKLEGLVDANQVLETSIAALREENAVANKVLEQLEASYMELKSQYDRVQATKNTEQLALKLATWKEGQKSTREKFQEVQKLVNSKNKALDHGKLFCISLQWLR